MGRRNFNDGQELVLEDMNAITKVIERTIYDRVAFEMMQRTEDAFFGDSFQVQFASSTSVTVRKGLGFQSDATQTSPEPQKRALFRSSDQNPSISAPDGALNRIDIVTVKNALVDELSLNRKFKDAITDIVSTQLLVVQKDWESVINIVAGVPDAAPVPPATPAGELKVAELAVTAVTGMAGAGAVTDKRTLMPVSGNALLNTLGFLRLTAGASTSLDTLMADIDGLMVNGKIDTNVFQDSVADPAAPTGALALKLYNKDGLLFVRATSGAISPVGAGGGGGGGSLNWTEPAGLAPIKQEEFLQEIYLFEKGANQKLVVYVEVSQNFISGRQVQANLGFYSPSAADEFKMQAVSTLIRKNVDAVNSVANQETNDTGDITNAVANRFRNLSIVLTTGVGQINGVDVSPGDLIKFELTRIAPGGTEDAADIRFIPTATGVQLL